MSDDEEYDFEADAEPIQKTEDEPEIDKDGYPISRGGKFQAQLNPLQQKMERLKKEKEEKAKADAKKAALASKLAAFGGAKKDTAGDKAAKEKEEAERKAKEEAAKPKEKNKIDNRVADMMKSEYRPVCSGI